MSPRKQPATGHLYGPVPSRRLGRSLGVDLIPYKICSYDCIYCQLGRTTEKTTTRGTYVARTEVLAELEQKLVVGPQPDYIGLAGSGEPTLHTEIGEIIAGIKQLTSIPVAVLTNGSLLGDPQVRTDLQAADLVLPSLDAGDQRVFEWVNRPHREISFDRLIDGLVTFSRESRASLWLEVFLLAGINDSPEQIEKMAAIARRINPARVQLNTVARPPTEERALAVPFSRLVELKAEFSGRVEVISEPEVTAPESSAELAPAVEAEIVALLGRRPCTLMGISAGLGLHPGDALKLVDQLCKQGVVKASRRGDANFYESVRS